MKTYYSPFLLGIVSKNAALVSLAAALALPPAGAEAAVLGSGHADIGVAFEDGAFDLHIHDETADQEFGPDEAVLRVNPSAFAVVPGDPRFAFLGAAGSSLWVLPQNEDPDLLYLGLAAEEIESGVFAGDTLTLTLKAVSGPGDFILYRTSGVLGEPSLAMNSRDGISDLNDRAGIAAGSHTDYNWAFTAPGDYSITFEASGTLAGGGAPVSSGPVQYAFQVIPEPGTFALAGMGLAALALAAHRRRTATARAKYGRNHSSAVRRRSRI